MRQSVKAKTERYKKWGGRRNAALKASRHYCCRCLTQKADDVHHARYWCLFRGDLAGKEITLIDTFAVCKDCHHLLHQASAWIRFKSSEKKHNRMKLLPFIRLLISGQIRRLPIISFLWLFSGIGILACLRWAVIAYEHIQQLF